MNYSTTVLTVSLRLVFLLLGATAFFMIKDILEKMISLEMMSHGDSLLAILIGLLGAFLLHAASRLLEASVPFAVSDCD